jgi:hypothetical protein
LLPRPHETVCVENYSLFLIERFNTFLLSFFTSEILRVVDSLQLTEMKKVATPVDWKVRVVNVTYIY